MGKTLFIQGIISTLKKLIAINSASKIHGFSAIGTNYFFFKENLTYVYWENDLGIFSCYVYDDDPIYKKINTKFFSNARTYPLWESNSKQSDKVKDIIFVQQYKKEFQITYTGKGSDGQWEYKQFWGPANTRDEALKVKKNLEDHGAKSNPYLQ